MLQGEYRLKTCKIHDQGGVGGGVMDTLSKVRLHETDKYYKSIKKFAKSSKSVVNVYNAIDFLKQPVTLDYFSGVFFHTLYVCNYYLHMI